MFQYPLDFVSAALFLGFIHDLKTAAGEPLTHWTRENHLQFVASL